MIDVDDLRALVFQYARGTPLQIEIQLDNGHVVRAGVARIELVSAQHETGGYAEVRMSVRLCGAQGV